jgi:hypothetical protein
MKGEHWAKRVHLLPPRYCQQCGERIEPQHRVHKRGAGKATMEWYWPKKFCSPRCVGLAAHQRVLDKARGEFVDKHGYVLLSNRVGEGGYQQPKHRAVMEYETVHHKNGIRNDNRPENLELWSSRHGRGQRVTDVEHSFGITEGLI